LNWNSAKPQVPSNSSLISISYFWTKFILDQNTLVTNNKQIAESNGGKTSHFIVKVSNSLSFKNYTRIETEVHYQIQRIATSTHSLPWYFSSTLTLSLGNFYGGYILSNASSILINLLKGPYFALKVFRIEDLSSLGARGKYIRIDEFEFHVCLSTENSLDSDHIPLLSNDHGWTIFHSVVTVSNLPMNVLETSIGFVDRSSIGDTSLSTVNNVKVEVNRTDLIRVGYPVYGNTFRISTNISQVFNDERVPLSSSNDVLLILSLSSSSLIHSTHKVQLITI